MNGQNHSLSNSYLLVTPSKISSPLSLRGFLLPLNGIWKILIFIEQVDIKRWKYLVRKEVISCSNNFYFLFCFLVFFKTMPSCSLGTPAVEFLWVYVYLHLSVHLSACTSVALFSWNLCTTLDWSFVQCKSWSREKVTELDFPEKILFALLWQKGSILVSERNFLQISLKLYSFYPTTHYLLLLSGVWGGTC